MRPYPRLFPLTDRTTATQRLLVISKDWPDDCEDVGLVASYEDRVGIITLWYPHTPYWRLYVDGWQAGPQSIEVTKAIIARSDGYGVIGYDPLAELPLEALTALEQSIKQGHGFLKRVNSWQPLNMILHLGWREYLLVVKPPSGVLQEVHHDH